MKLTEIGTPPWTEEDIKNKLDEFAELYKSRPIENNTWGMKAPHLFATWFIIQHVKFKTIVESGIAKGQGTWVIEQANPDAKVFSIDILLNQRKYISDKVTYFGDDFSILDSDDQFGENFCKLDKENTLCFFDDHIHAFNRTKLLYENNFKYAIFEDNYPTGKGDVVSLKQKFDACGEDSDYLRSIIKTYYEFPPIVKLEKNRWKEKWDKYPIKDPVLSSIENPLHQIYKDEADNYTWLCYVELKNKI